MEHANLAACYEEFSSLQGELNGLDELHKEYVQKVNELTKLQQNCWKGINHQRYRMKAIESSLKRLDAKNSADEEERRTYYKTKKELIKREIRLQDMDDYLPRKSGRYLNIILGSVNVSLLTKADRYTYKDEYEKFKVIVTVIALFCSFISLVVLRFRVMDSIIMFLLVWYYCTLTIRESILKVNGSKIKGWWRTHHFLSTVAAGVLLTWPDSRTYHEFRDQFLLFNCYIAVVQLLQFRYQQGCLYRLKALGERHNMDITIEGFHSWMWRGLSFLLPFLYLGYMFQLYNAYVLYYITMEDYCKEWQVPILSVMFFALFLGNIITTSMVIPQKLKEKLTLKYRFPRFRKNGMKEQGTQTGSPPNSADEAEPEVDSPDKKAL